MTRRQPQRSASRVPGRGPLASVPPLVAFLAVAALFGLGVWIRGPVGAVLLAVLGLFVLAVLAATWARLTAAERALRAAVVAILAVVIVSVLL